MKLSTRKSLACLQIALQLFSSSSLVYFSPSYAESAQDKSSVLSANDTNNREGQDANRVAQAAVQAGSLLSSDDAATALSTTVISTATGEASSAVQKWLNQFGTARVNISTDEHFTLSDSELDLLLPLYNEKEHLFFTQLGGRRHDDRNVINTGLGYRHFSDDWMWGTNLFYDRQVSDNHHERLGVGAELGWDYVKLAANGYFRLSDWMASSQYRDYDERAANGFDVRATGYLPAYPQLGANIIYEKYYGDSVGLFGDDEDDRQKNPYAVTLGLNYTPVPLITLGANQKMGKSGQNDTQLNLSVNWSPGVPLRDQLDPSALAQRRSLMGSRQDLVDRNNNIVLEYRKQELISLSLPTAIQGEEQTKQSVTAKVKTKYGLERIEWQAASFLSNGGKITSGGSAEQFVFTLPAWQGSGVNSYTLKAIAWDKKGNASDASEMKVNVSGINVTTLQSTTVVSPASIPADGASTANVTVSLKTTSGENASGLAARLTATLSAAKMNTAQVSGEVAEKNATIGHFNETSTGVYVATVTAGTQAETLTIQPLIDGNVKLASAKLTEEATQSAAQLTSVDVPATSALANGVMPLTLTAHVTDQNGNVVKDATVDWSADNPQAKLSANTTLTDANGTAQIQVSSTAVITTVVTAQLLQGNAISTPSLSFTADITRAEVSAISAAKKQVVANNNDTDIITAQVTDNANHPLGGVTVNWVVNKTDGTKITEKTSVSDVQGKATLSLKSAKTGTVTVSASVNNGKAQTTDPITFVADSSTQKIDGITVSTTKQVADGASTIRYEATVRNAEGLPLPDITVNWSADNSNVTLSQNQTISDANGVAAMTVSSKKAGSVIVTAQTSESAPFQAEAAIFTADPTTARVGALSSDKQRALANGTTAIKVSATVVDANENPLSAAEVKWAVSPSTGQLSATSSTTQADGVADVLLTTTTVDRYSVEASINGSTKTLGDLTFTGDPGTATVSSLSADKMSGIIAGKDNVTLTAKVIDANQNPITGVIVNWSSSETSSRFSESASTTDAQGIAKTQFSSLKAGNIEVTAAAGASSQTAQLQVIGNVATAQVTDVKANTATAVADGQEKISWTATVADENGNVLTGASVNWRADLDGVTLSPQSSQTDSSGSATTEGTSVKSGVVTVTATPDANPSGSHSGNSVTFTADAKTATLTKLTPSADSAYVGTGEVTYRAEVVDGNNNPLPSATVSWSTTLNSLSATETQSDSGGIATVKLSGSTVGQVTVKATIGNSELTNKAVTFIDDYRGSWDISVVGTTVQGDNWDSQHIGGIPNMAFVTTGDTQGPDSLISDVMGSSPLTVPMTDQNGKTWNVIVQGRRATACNVFQLNSYGQPCYEANAPVWANLVYSSSTNASLPAGVYRGTIQLLGKSKGTQWSYKYDVETTLTITE